jgi:hypothetical protein
MIPKNQIWESEKEIELPITVIDYEHQITMHNNNC